MCGADTQAPVAPRARGTDRPDPARRLNAELLGAFLLILLVVFASVDGLYLLTVPGYAPPWYGYVFLVSAWLLNHSGRYTAAAVLTLTMFPIVIFTGVLSSRAGDPSQSLSYLAIGVLVASILFSARGTLLFAAACALAIALLPQVLPSVAWTPRVLGGPFSLLVMVTGLAVASILHRSRIESDRQAELRESEQRLRQALQAEERVTSERQALIRELEAKNAELERFTYTVSHDLKSPLITIRGFIGSIDRDVDVGRTDRLHEDVDRVLSATDHMQRLLDELLVLSRVGRIANPPERVSFDALARDAAGTTSVALKKRAVALEIEPGLPDVYVDRVRVLELLQNLLENAAKFMGEQATPRIRIGARGGEAEGPVVFYVEDNGIGIEPGLQERVFGLFEKLDARAEGTGVGLAIARRIVEVHGGRIWIESAGRGRGTRVCFTLEGKPET